MSASRRGEPEASTSLGRPIIFPSTIRAVAPAHAPGQNAQGRANLFEPVGDATLTQATGRHLDQNLVARGTNFGAKLAEGQRVLNCISPLWSIRARPLGQSLVTNPARREPRTDARRDLIAHRPIGIEPLRAVAFDIRGIGDRPIFDVSGEA